MDILEFMKDQGVWIATVVAAIIAVLGGKTSNIVGGGGEDRLNGRVAEWFIVGFVIILLILFYMLFEFSKETKTLPKETTVERKAEPTYPQDITGNYLVRTMNGSENVNATIKIYKIGSEYAMNVYSSSITKKFTFSYNPSSGVLLSKELGTGGVKIKELTNEIEITFKGWKLVK